MSQEPKNNEEGFMYKLASFIVDKRNLIFLIVAIGLVFSAFSRNWVQVENQLSAYLPKDSETYKGLHLMEDEFITFGTAKIMLVNVTYDEAQAVSERLEAVDGVQSVTFDDTKEHYTNASALYNITFDYSETDDMCETVMERVEDELSGYDMYVSATFGDTASKTLAQEIGVIVIIVAIVVVSVLILTSQTYAEVPVLLITFIAAALLNMGTNFLLGTISFVSNSVTSILQLALSLDYAVILCNRFKEEHQLLPVREAAIVALSKAIPEIGASSLTTVGGLAAMLFMQFKLGPDMAICLIKSIAFALLSAFLVMPGLLMLFSKAMERTRHRSFIPRIDRWGGFVLKLRHVGVPLFIVALVGGFFLSNRCPYVYGYTQIETARQNESQVAEQRVSDTFGTQNVIALLVPRGDYDSEKALLERLEACDQVDYAMGISNIEVMDGHTLTDALTPRQFSEMTDLDYELVCLLYTAYAAEEEAYGRIVGGLDDYAVPLMDMFFFAYDKAEEGYVDLDEGQQADLDDLYEQLDNARVQMLGENYTRMLINLNLPEEGAETFAFLQTIHREAERYYDADSVYLVGDSTSDYDLSVSFARDNIMISVLSVVFVIIVLLFTFQSVGLPILLILVIQGSIWINFSFPGMAQKPIFFLSYLIVTAIQMGANIDYAIVISSWYNELKAEMSRREAIVQALNLSFPTVLTSGSILSSAGFLIAQITTEPAIVGIGECLCRGTLISMFLVMFILPQILFLGDGIVERTRFDLKVPEVARSAHGTVYVNGRVRGRISGVVDAQIQGVIYGDVSGMLETGAYQKEEEPAHETEDS